MLGKKKHPKSKLDALMDAYRRAEQALDEARRQLGSLDHIAKNVEAEIERVRSNLATTEEALADLQRIRRGLKERIDVARPIVKDLANALMALGKQVKECERHATR